jgi:hypothetical protein
VSETAAISEVVGRMQQRLDGLAGQPHRAAFLSTYLRTTQAVGSAVAAGTFLDADWVTRWDVAFAELYLDAYDAHVAGEHAQVPRPWQLAFAIPEEQPALRHVLLGINAHVNYDLPQALLAVIGEQDWDDPLLLARRREDHGRIDGVLASRVKAEEDEFGNEQTFFDRAIGPLNRLGSKRFLRESREKVWLNTEQLHAARVIGPQAYRERLAELELLSAAKVVDLLAPGQILLRLAVSGFGVVLPPPRRC